MYASAHFSVKALARTTTMRPRQPPPPHTPKRPFFAARITLLHCTKAQTDALSWLTSWGNRLHPLLTNSKPWSRLAPPKSQRGVSAAHMISM